MSGQDYWNNTSSNQYQNYSQPPNTNQDNYSSPYGQDQSHYSHQRPTQSQDNEPLNWGYGGGDQQQQSPQQGHDYYGSAPQYGQQDSPYDQNQGYGQPYRNYNDPHQTQTAYHDGRNSPQPPHYNFNATTTDYERQPSHYPDQGFNPQAAAGQDPYPGVPGQAEGERGLLGAIGGAAAGGYAGHQVNHGFIGAVGGAYAGHKLEEHLKDKKTKDKKHRSHSHSHGGRRNSSSSDSDSSSDEEKKKRKHHQKYGTATAVGAGGAAAAAYAHHQHQHQHGGHHQSHDGGHHHQRSHSSLAGNFSASSRDATLDRDYDLIASCATVDGRHRLSSISLNDCLTNSRGQLAWARGGGFAASARRAQLVDGGRVLEAELGDGHGGWNVSRIRLDERITNNDGDLQFLD